jgi:regulator of RNase E activity RraA
MDDIIQQLTAVAVADNVAHEQIMDVGIRPVWAPVRRLIGQAYTVRCPHNDNTMVHAAAYCAPPGAIVVVQAEGVDFAVAGGNMCALAQKNGIQGFVIDGALRDIAEIREMGLPVFSRGLYPKPGLRGGGGDIELPVTCGGVRVETGDFVVADEDGVAVIPKADKPRVLSQIAAQFAKEKDISFEQWVQNHCRALDKVLAPQNLSLWENRRVKV